MWKGYISHFAAQNVAHGWLPYEDNGDDVEPPYAPHCSSREFAPCIMCGFSNATVQFLHWPVDADESHLCPNRDAANATAAVSSSLPSGQVVTAKWSEFTLTSPTAYAYFKEMTHDNGCGSTHTNILLPIRPEDVSTIVNQNIYDGTSMKNAGLKASKLDYRHLAYSTIGSFSVPLIPHSAYLGDGKCGYLGPQCQTIFQDYQPGILYKFYPGALRSVDPAWSDCENQQFVAWDPPIVLKPSSGDLPKVTLPRFPIPLASPTSMFDRIPLHLLPLQATASVNPRPGAIIPGPFAMETDPGQYLRPSGGSEPARDNKPGVLVSKISLFTVMASAAGGHAGLIETIAPEGVRGSNQYRPANDAKPAILGSSPQNSQPQDAFADNPSPGNRHPKANALQNEAVFIHSSKTYTAKQLSPGTFVLDGSTFSAGGSALPIGGAFVSAIGEGVVVQSSSAPFLSLDSNDSAKDDSEEEKTRGLIGDIVSAKTKAKKNAAANAMNILDLQFLFGRLLSLHMIIFFLYL
jgi:hypothetical protein